MRAFSQYDATNTRAVLQEGDVPALQQRSILMPSTTASGRIRNLTRTPRKRPSTPQQLMRQNQALLMYATGSSIVAIAKALKTSRETIARDINEESRRREREFPDERRVVVRQQLQTLDTLKNRVMAAITAQGENGPAGLEAWHVNAVLQIEERRAKLLGIDAPKQVNIEFRGGSYASAAENPLANLETSERVALMRRALEASRKVATVADETIMKNITPSALPGS